MPPSDNAINIWYINITSFRLYTYIKHNNDTVFNDCGMGWFQVDFSEKDICHDHEIDILGSLAKLQLFF